MRILWLTLLPWLLAASVVKDQDDIKYFIKFGEQTRAVMYIKRSTEGAEATYYNVSKHDKIAFYAPKKSFTLTDTLPTISMATLEVDKFKDTIVYDIRSLNEMQIEEADVSENTIDKTAAVIAGDGELSMTFEKRPIHTFESILVSLMQSDALFKETFYLYEPQKGMVLKVFFESAGKAPVDIDGKKCQSDLYVMKIFGNNKALVDIYYNKLPLVAEANSKTWRFELAGIGKPERKTVRKEDIILDAIEEKANKELRAYKHKVTKKERDHFRSYIVEGTAAVAMDDDKVKENLNTFLARTSTKTLNRVSAKDNFLFTVDEDDVIDALKNEYKIVDDKYIEKAIKNRTIAHSNIRKHAEKLNLGCKADPKSIDTLICGDKKKSYDTEDVVESYLEAKDKYVKVDDVELSDAKTPGKFKLDFTALQPIKPEMLIKAAHDALKKKYSDAPLSHLTPKKGVKGEYFIKVPKPLVEEFACKGVLSKAHSSLQYVDYVNETCNATFSFRWAETLADGEFTQYFNSMYPDVGWMGIQTKTGNGSVTFNYLDTIKGLPNECSK